MSLQRFIAPDEKAPALNGARECGSETLGGWQTAKIENCPCDDGMRRTVYRQGEADTVFSIPAACRVKGKIRKGYITGTEGGPTFRFMDSALADMGITRVEMNEYSGNPEAWECYAVSFGNGNDGLSRLYPSYVLWCHPDSLHDVARLAVVQTGRASRAYLAKALQVDESGPDAVQAMVLDPPGDRSGSWSQGNGAWLLCDVYPVAEASDSSKAPAYDGPEACFGRAGRALAERNAA